MQAIEIAHYFSSQSVSISSSKMLIGNRCFYYVSIIVGLANYCHASNYKVYQDSFD